MKKILIGWKLSRLNLHTASSRYRVLLPLLSLRKIGISGSIFDSGLDSNLTGVDVLVIVKSFKFDDIALAYAAAEKNIPVIFDVCDNVFVDGYNTGFRVSPAYVLRQIAKVASAFVTPTETLADILRDQLGSNVAVHVVPDGIETTELSQAMSIEIQRAQEVARQRKLMVNARDTQFFEKLIELLRTEIIRGAAYRSAKRIYHKLERMRRKALTSAYRLIKRAYHKLELMRLTVLRSESHIVQQRSKKAISDIDVAFISSETLSNTKRLLWYGNHGSEYYGRFGLTDIVDHRDALERIAEEFNVELTVVSNNEEKFGQLIAPLSITSRYVEWTPARVREELARADMVLVPNSCDAFSISKSANRTILALMSNRPVVATLTPALAPISDCIEAGDFYTGIRRYLTEPQRVADHLANAHERCTQLYGQEAITSAWLGVLDAVSIRAAASQLRMKIGLLSGPIPSTMANGGD